MLAVVGRVAQTMKGGISNKIKARSISAPIPPQMNIRFARNTDRIRQAGYSLLDRFVLPEQDWWKEYYTPIERKLVSLRSEYDDDPEALAVLEEEEREIELFRRYASFYGYVFYLTQLEERV